MNTQNGYRGASLILACALIALPGLAQSADACSANPAPNRVDFSSVPPATTVLESQARLEARKAIVLANYAQRTPLPSACREPGNSFAGDLNLQLDSRSDVVLLTERAVAKILRKEAAPEVEDVFLAGNTAVFSNTGTSSEAIAFEGVQVCKARVGDYDFSLIDLLNLYYVAKENDPEYQYFSSAARKVILDRMLNLRGKIIDRETYRFDCVFGSLEIEDTENHILMKSISRYLTNQLLYKPNTAGNSAFDNVALGNKAWMLNHLAALMREHFYEYNSRPYQQFTVDAISVLYSYSDDAEVKLAAKNLLDMASAWSAVQSNNMRRFAPFRRQPVYSLNASAVEGNSDFERLAVLVGNYRSLGAGVNDLTSVNTSGKALFALSGKYRMDPAILDLAIKGDPANRYFVGKHFAAEMYASSPGALISAGGNSTVGRTPWFDIKLVPGNFLEPVVRAQVDKFVMPKFKDDFGFARPTVVIPSREPSTSWEDMVRFEGNRDLSAAIRGENLCVAPGFACGLQLKLGKRLEGLVSACSTASTKIPGMRFYNLNQGSTCPQYGLYLAVYEKPCDTDACQSRADNYGFVEVAEAGSRSFNDFVNNAEASNATVSFASTGVHTYKTQSGVIKFEIAPVVGQASIVEVNGAVYDRDYQTWPRARGQTLQSSTPGIMTVDSIPLNRRLILDMSNASKPRNIAGTLPFLMRYDGVGGAGGKHFEDGQLVVANSNVKWVALSDGVLVTGIGMGWQSGMEVSHGSSGYDSRLDLQNGEYIQEVKVCTGPLSNINYMHVKTNYGRQIKAGDGWCLIGQKRTYQAGTGQQIIAFHGRATEGSTNTVDNLGVIMTAR